MKQLSIEKCRDEKRVLALIKEIFPDAVPPISKTHLYFVAVLGKEDVGFLHIIPREGKLLLQGIGVKESHRKEGIGSRLMDVAVSLAEKEGKEMLLKVKPGNYVALALYAKKGFVIKKLRNSYILQRKACN